MKKILFLILCGLLCPDPTAQSQHASEMKAGYYVVVAAFYPSQERLAVNYSNSLTERGFNATFGFNSARKYYFVYLNFFDNLKESLVQMQATRKQNVDDFAKAWVRVVSGSIMPAADVPLVLSATSPVQPSAAGSTIVALDSTRRTARAKEATSTMQSSVPAPGNNQYSEPAGEGQLKPSPHEDGNPAEEDDPAIFLSLFNSTNNRIVQGNVDVIDMERTKKLVQVPGNDYVHLPDPKNETKQLTLVCEVFGYRKIQHDIRYPVTLADTIRSFVDLMGNTMVVKFDLVRYHRGDIATLFNVYFFNDAAIMLPESRYQLEELLQMLKENDHYRILLHGHTNGHYHGRILTMGENKNLFSLDGSRSGVGSAKDLSYSRAAVIKEYLSENGIDESRVSIKAWGGKRPIFNKHGANARKNVRVEVEILAD